MPIMELSPTRSRRSEAGHSTDRRDEQRTHSATRASAHGWSDTSTLASGHRSARSERSRSSERVVRTTSPHRSSHAADYLLSRDPFSGGAQRRPSEAPHLAGVWGAAGMRRPNSQPQGIIDPLAFASMGDGSANP